MLLLNSILLLAFLIVLTLHAQQPTPYYPPKDP